ncbi:hypothetical protein [Chamaesiphon sp.]|uniref:hypothetical protein n=1 Tax=Chamaesiphon sp. TaxID=2814140 RepID=UPI0035937282
MKDSLPDERELPSNNLHFCKFYDLEVCLGFLTDCKYSDFEEVESGEDGEYAFWCNECDINFRMTWDEAERQKIEFAKNSDEIEYRSSYVPEPKFKGFKPSNSNKKVKPKK